MAYWTPNALQQLAQSESGGRADLIHYPSGYTRDGTPSSASGLFGFIDSTWRSFASKAGVDTSQYPRAYMAPADVQTAVALQTPISNWTCPRCNSFAQQLAQDPANISATPVSGGTGFGGGDYGSSGEYGTSQDIPFGTYGPGATEGPGVSPEVGSGGITFSMDPGGSGDQQFGDFSPRSAAFTPPDPSMPFGTGTDAPGGVPTGNNPYDPAAAAAGGGGALAKLLAYLLDKGERFALIALGIVLVAAAAFALARGELGGGGKGGGSVKVVPVPA